GAARAGRLQAGEKSPPPRRTRRSTRQSGAARTGSGWPTRSAKPPQPSPPKQPSGPRPPRHNQAMRVSAKVDYALRACAELAAAGEGPVKGDRLAQAQEIPLKFLENILLDLKHAGLVQSQRGAEGGYWLSLPPDQISLAEVIRAVEGPIANVRGRRPELVEY